MDRFDEELKNFMKDEFIEIKATPELKKKFLTTFKIKSLILFQGFGTMR